MDSVFSHLAWTQQVRSGVILLCFSHLISMTIHHLCFVLSSLMLVWIGLDKLGLSLVLCQVANREFLFNC